MSSDHSDTPSTAIEEDDPQPQRQSKWRRVVVITGAALALLAVIADGIALHHGEQTEAEVAANCPTTSRLIQKLKPLVHGEIAALNLASKPAPLPSLSFEGPAGKSLTLADFHGRDVLFNLWATWCVPCRQEMPALDRLEAKLGGQSFEVVAVNIDTVRLHRPKAFLDEIGVKSLGFYSDSTADVFQVLKQDGKVLGLPTTILIGKDGCEIGTMSGPAQWDSDEAVALVKALKG
jgi:thiol-disulfide isomerase/thioredoxin